MGVSSFAADGRHTSGRRLRIQRACRRAARQGLAITRQPVHAEFWPVHARPVRENTVKLRNQRDDASFWWANARPAGPLHVHFRGRNADHARFMIAATPLIAVLRANVQRHCIKVRKIAIMRGPPGGPGGF